MNMLATPPGHISIADENGTRLITLEKDRRFRDEAAARFAAFWQALEWHSINTYDKQAAPSVVLRSGKQWAFGAWLQADLNAIGGAPPAVGWSWRHLQDYRMGDILEFDPLEFAAVDEQWQELLSMD